MQRKQTMKRLIELIDKEEFSREYESYFEMNDTYSRLSCDTILDKILKNKNFEQHCLKNIRCMPEPVLKYFNEEKKSLFD